MFECSKCKTQRYIHIPNDVEMSGALVKKLDSFQLSLKNIDDWNVCVTDDGTKMLCAVCSFPYFFGERK